LGQIQRVKESASEYGLRFSPYERKIRRSATQFMERAMLNDTREYRIFVSTTKSKTRGIADTHLVYTDHLEELAQKVYGTYKSFDVYGGKQDSIHEIGSLGPGPLDPGEQTIVEIDCKKEAACFIEDVCALIHDLINRRELPSGYYRVRVRDNKP
jgi:hypothetical protein